MALPMELVTSIMARLPVKSLLRFKSVSKEWYILISTRYFIQLHNNHTPPGGHIDDQHLIVVGKGYFECRTLNSHLTRAVKFTVPSPSNAEDRYVNVLCSCNGLVILCCSYEFDYRDNVDYGLIMWNPLTNNYFVIPYPDLPDNEEDDFFIGLGYDKSNDDYKLVMFSYINHMSHHSYSRHIYSLKRNCWGAPLIKDTGYTNHFRGHNALIHNHIIHWLFRDCHRNNQHYYGNNIRLRGFDICSEEWLDVPLPDITQEHGWFFHLGILDDYLCTTNRNFDDNTPMRVWVMKEYGVKESWVQLFVLSTSSNHVMETTLNGPPAAYSMGGDEVAMKIWCKIGDRVYNYVMLYNLKDKTWTTLGECHYSLDFTHFVASLVPDPIQDRGNSSCFITEYKHYTRKEGFEGSKN